MPYAGRINVAGDSDWFRVYLRGNNDYTFQTTSAGDTTITVYDASGQQVAFNDNAGPNQLNAVVTGFRAPATDDYYLAVRGASNTLPSYVLRSYVTGALQMPRPQRVRFLDLDGSGGPSAGDALEVTFTEEMSLLQPTLSNYPAGNEFRYPVQGDAFGSGANIVLGPASNQVTVQLGTGARFTVAGQLDGTGLAAGDPSGLDVDLTSNLTGVVSAFPPARWATDIE